MATYILFWNPTISSYTKERFLNDFDEVENVGNWSFHEHEDVDYGDIFYMVKCGEGKTGIVMRGNIVSKCYESDDWSPKKRGNIFYADIEPGMTINPWTDAKLLSPEELTDKIPDFNWFGGHSGRKLSDEDAEKLDRIWLEYLDNNPSIVSTGQAWYDDYDERTLIPYHLRKELSDRNGNRCEVCNYSYADVFDAETVEKDKLYVWPKYIVGAGLSRCFFNVCNNCDRVDDEILGKILKDKKDK